jgi:flagellar protein FliO/FliZ
MSAPTQSGLRRASWCRRLGVGVALLLVCGARAADENAVIFPATGTPSVNAPATTTGGTLHSMSLFLGLALAGAGGWMVWRNRRGQPVGRDMRALAINETRSLGNRQFLVVASYEGKKFLLGVCPGRIDLLSSLNGDSGSAPGKSLE